MPDELADIQTTRRELQDLFKIGLEVEGSPSAPSAVSFQCFARLFEKAKELRSQNLNLRASVTFADQKCAKAESELAAVRPKLTLAADEAEERRKKDAKRMEELGSEIKRLNQNIRQLESKLQRLQQEKQDANNKKLEAEFKDKFVVAMKADKTMAADVVNRLDYENKTLKKHVDILTANLTGLFGLVREVSNSLFRSQQLRREFLKTHYKTADGKEPQVRDLERIPAENPSFLDPKLCDPFKQNIANFAYFSDQFDGLLSENFRNFLKRKNCFFGKNDAVAFEDVFREKNLARIKDFQEMTGVLESYQEMIRNHQRFCAENTVDDELDDVTESLLFTGKGSRGPPSDLDELTGYLRAQEDLLRDFRAKKNAIDEQISRDVTDMAQKIQEHL